MKFFAVLLLAAYSFNCAVAQDGPPAAPTPSATPAPSVTPAPSASDKVEEKFKQGQDAVESEFEKIWNWATGTLEDAMADITLKGGNFPQCSDNAGEELKKAYDKVSEKLAKKKEDLVKELQEEHDAAVENIEKEEQKEKLSWGRWFAKIFATIFKAIHDGFWNVVDAIVGKASDFLEFRKEFSKEVAIITDNFNKCLSNAE